MKNFYFLENFEIAMIIKGREVQSSSEIFQDVMSLSRKKLNSSVIPILEIILTRHSNSFKIFQERNLNVFYNMNYWCIPISQDKLITS